MNFGLKIRTEIKQFYILPFVRIDWIVESSIRVYSLQVGWFLWYLDLDYYKMVKY